ncbi:MAG TPA: hypothetical protein VHI52_05655, partial [Verrucomicrobiae bacterium]|nr:hypothetical protein [Verrucomicrobiae bacterium]
TPQDVGATNWDQVQPLGRSKAVDLPSRRLFYWTVRFLSWDSARHFANATRALQKASYPDLPVFVDLRVEQIYSPLPGGADAADAATGGPDWLEFGRLRGVSMLWHDFSNAHAAASSLVSAKLRSAADKGGVQFGGYISLGGNRQDDAVRNILTVIGNGGKGLFYWIGPTEHFTYKAYTENPSELAGIAEADRMIGQAEDLLWPGKEPRAQVAILAPRSAELWNHERSSIPGYTTEVSNLYRALESANIPVDFVEEDDLSPKRLDSYKVLYVTEPNIPVEFQSGLAAWVQGGGTLAMSKGAGGSDRYNEPCDILSKSLVSPGHGQVVHFTWLPGTYSADIRDAMLSPMYTARVEPPVKADVAMIETPLLLSAKGAAITVLNWSGKVQKQVTVTAQVPFTVKSVESVEQGKLAFTQSQRGITCRLPLATADIILLTP